MEVKQRKNLHWIYQLEERPQKEWHPKQVSNWHVHSYVSGEFELTLFHIWLVIIKTYFHCWLTSIIAYLLRTLRNLRCALSLLVIILSQSTTELRSYIGNHLVSIVNRWERVKLTKFFDWYSATTVTNTCLVFQLKMGVKSMNTTLLSIWYFIKPKDIYRHQCQMLNEQIHFYCCGNLCLQGHNDEWP